MCRAQAEKLGCALNCLIPVAEKITSQSSAGMKSLDGMNMEGVPVFASSTKHTAELAEQLPYGSGASCRNFEDRDTPPFLWGPTQRVLTA